ncbi:MAG: hypothetical protein KJO84_09190 [Acidimicrobiia bacterium]|nr:hypothetical protein [Acidimicrobiia bacterium]
MTDQIDPAIEERLRAALQDESGLLPPAPSTTPPHLAEALPTIATTSGPVTTGYDAFYEAHRDELYRALALTLADRDLATEAVDRSLGNAFTTWRRTSKLDDPRTKVFHAGYEWARKRQGKSGRGVSGFRLEWETDETNADIISTLRGLPTEQRAVLVARHYMGWDAAASAAALGTTAQAVVSRDVRATEAVAAAMSIDTAEASRVIPGALLADANGLAVPLSRLDSTKSRGWARRGMAALAGAAAVIVVVGGVGLGYQALTGGNDDPEGGTTAGTTVNGTTDSTIVTSLADPATLADLEWTRIPLGAQDGDISQIAYGASGFVALGNDWQNGRSLAFVSEDGLAWEQIQAPMDSNNGWIAGLQTGDFGYIAVGTIYDNFGGGNQAMVWTSEDGFAWTESQLSAVEQEEIAGINVQWYTDVYNVSAANGKFIAVGSQWADIGDPQRFFEDSLPDDVSLWWGWDIDRSNPDDPALIVYGEEGQSQESFPFSEIGLDPALADVIWSNRALVWTSEDGETWTEGTAVEGFGADSGIGRIAAGESGFVASVWQRFGQGLYYSATGEKWERIELPRGSQVNDVTAYGSTYLAVGTSAGSGAVFTSSDGLTWEVTTDEALQADYIERIAAGPAGFALIARGSGSGGINELPPAILDNGTIQVEMYQDGTFTVYDSATGDELYTLYGDEVTYSNRGDVTFTDPESGETTTFTADEVNLAWEQVYMSFEESMPVEPFEETGPRILVSANGTDWVEMDTTAAFGQSFYPNSLALGPDAIVMAGWQEGGFGFEQAPKPSVWVGIAP